jgi:hypothetical protein
MVKVKVLRIDGEVITRNGRRASNLFERIEKELGGFLSSLPRENIISITQSVNSDGVASGGNATYTVTYVEEAESAPEDSGDQKPRRGRKGE